MHSIHFGYATKQDNHGDEYFIIRLQAVAVARRALRANRRVASCFRGAQCLLRMDCNVTTSSPRCKERNNDAFGCISSRISMSTSFRDRWVLYHKGGSLPTLVASVRRDATNSSSLSKQGTWSGCSHSTTCSAESARRITAAVFRAAARSSTGIKQSNQLGTFVDHATRTRPISDQFRNELLQSPYGIFVTIEDSPASSKRKFRR